eukprot:2522116-Lingulodinium_polyedra.AAC.1
MQPQAEGGKEAAAALANANPHAVNALVEVKDTQQAGCELVQETWTPPRVLTDLQPVIGPECLHLTECYCH